MGPSCEGRQLLLMNVCAPSRGSSNPPGWLALLRFGDIIGNRFPRGGNWTTVALPCEDRSGCAAARDAEAPFVSVRPRSFPLGRQTRKRTFSPELSLVQGLERVRFRTPWDTPAQTPATNSAGAQPGITKSYDHWISRTTNGQRRPPQLSTRAEASRTVPLPRTTGAPPLLLFFLRSIDKSCDACV
jgi:hypothetical protein